jgi:guanyl-specific ribonuclease Sa
VKPNTPRRTSLLGWVVVALIALAIGQAWLPTELSPAAGTQLPQEERRAIQATLELIEAGGPFPYAKDGSEFGNREGLLPQNGPGYYREYTVDTPGSPDRGARRIVAGGNGEFYYTRDHYRSFVRLE